MDEHSRIFKFCIFAESNVKTPNLLVLHSSQPTRLENAYNFKWNKTGVTDFEFVRVLSQKS